MSNKVEDKAMKSAAERALEPKLRFPEFRDAGEWEEKAISFVADLKNGYAFKSSEYVESGKFRIITISNVQAGSLVVEQTKSLSQLPPDLQPHQFLGVGDILISMTGNVGRVCRVNTGNCLLNQRVGKLVPFEIDPSFFYFILQNDNFRNSMQQQAAGGAQGNLSSSDILNFVFCSPATLGEQQKIAGCLSSIDELITAQTQKLDTLKAHKKGLMQQLFPAEGETLPMLRFSEFRDAGEWEGCELGPKTIKVGSGITPNGGDKNYKQNGRPFVRSQNIGWGELILDDVAFIDDETHATFASTEISEFDVLLNITGASIGRSAIADSRIVGGNVNQHVCIIRLRALEMNPAFLNQYLLSQYGQKQIDSFQAGGNRQGLNFAQVRSFSIPAPPKLDEQVRVADCLSSIDELIAAQTQKLDTLKAHKNGLMQQLFPALDEVQG